MPDNNSKLAKNIWIIVISLLIVAPLFLIYLYVAGQHDGSEFSPDDFSRRTFSYNKTPGLNWVIHRKVYYDRNSNIGTELVADGLITPNIKVQTWHLTRDSSATPDLVSHDCDARFLTRYLDLTNKDGEPYWTQWNDDYPRCAAIFWPVVADLARHEMYLRIPDLMNLAMDIDSDEPEQLLPRMKKLVADLYLELGSLDFKLGRTERARTRLMRSDQFAPSTKAKSELARCLDKLGPDSETKVEPELILIIPPKEESETDENSNKASDTDTKSEQDTENNKSDVDDDSEKKDSAEESEDDA